MSPGDLYWVGPENGKRGMIEILAIDPDRISYYYHISWPTRAIQPISHPNANTLRQIAIGWWTLYDPALQVSEGL